MKIKRFVADDVHGYLDFDIKFNEQLTFLIGINGAGKTTALKLLLGLLTPSYKDLCKIDFSYAQIECFFKDKIVISASKMENNFIRLSVNRTGQEKVENVFMLAHKDNKYIKELNNRDESTSILNDEFNQLKVVETIRKLSTPFFLGLNRQTFEQFYPEKMTRNKYRNIQKPYLVDEHTNNGLIEVQEMVFDFTRRIARGQPRLSDDFKNKIFKNSFQFIESTNPNANVVEIELPRIKERRLQFKKAISNLEIINVGNEIITFFDKIEDTLNNLVETGREDQNLQSPEYYNFLLKWFINSHQLDRIDEIIKLSTEYQKRILRLKEPILKFSRIINQFFHESGKMLEITGEGELKIAVSKNGNKKYNSIFELASGEKQIIIMIANLVFCSNKNNPAIFVIDEPELSLHITWQEIFVDALLEASPETQFILATHAPAIIARVGREELCEDLSKKRINAGV